MYAARRRVSTDIQGGVFNNVVEDRNFSNGNAPRLEGITITNGTFASPVREEYLAEGYSFTLEDGNYVPANTAAVAEIDREGVVYPFAELAAALEAAQSGDRKWSGSDRHFLPDMSPYQSTRKRSVKNGDGLL